MALLSVINMVHLKALRNFSKVHMVHIATHLHLVIPRRKVPLDHLPILTEHRPILMDHRPIPTDHLRIPTDHLIAMDHHPIPTMDHQHLIAMDHKHPPIATDLHMEFPDSQPVSLNHPVSLKYRETLRSPKSPPTQRILIHHHYPQTPTPPPSLTILPTPLLPHRHQTVLHHRPENQPLTALKERSLQGHRIGSNSLHHHQHILMDLHHPMVHNHHRPSAHNHNQPMAH